MIDLEKLKPILTGYKVHFLSHWEDEKYKWEAIKHFKEHWDIEAEDFSGMLGQAIDKTYNLLASGYAYPGKMIKRFAEKDGEAVRQMFRGLFDESRGFAERVTAFQAASEKIRATYDDGTWRNHYQNTNAVSTYLWLMFPDKYYIYRYELYRDVAAELSADYKPKRDGSAETMIDGFAMYDEICAAVRQDDEIKALLRDALTDSCYADPAMKTVTMDIGFYLSRYYLKEKQEAQEKASWFPKDYTPGITADEWSELLRDASVFQPNYLQIMRRMKDYGGQATCTQLAAKYGEKKNFYNSGSTALARRVAEKTGCPLLMGDDERNRYWPVLYMGKDAPKEEKGSYIWRLRPELSEALDRTDLSQIPLYADGQRAAVPKYTKEDFLSAVYMTEERYDVLEALLRNKKNIILQGAPGVGKTFTAKKLAYAMMGMQDDSRIKLVQFHQNYSYEDFVMGYRPDGAGFKLTDGIFYRFCKEAAKQPDKPYFFIIDEINRGNMSKIFGELLMLIEKDYRGAEMALAYSGEAFSVPENLYIIGMMNTADRSLAMIDYALRRRFSFFEMEPGFGSDGFMQYQKEFANETFDALIEQIKMLNREIAEDGSLGRGFRIGHSYFCGRKPEECTTDWMWSVVEFDILPMLSEYWFDEPARLQRWEKNLRGVFDDE